MVYLVLCICGEMYIGMSTRSVHKWIVEHRSKIKNKIRNSSGLFFEAGHSEMDFKYCVIEKIEKHISTN